MLSDFPTTEIDADEMEQGIAELEDVIAHYGMFKIRFSSSSGTV